MIRIETEKLNLKKSLLDVQIDNNKLIEDSESRSMEVFPTTLIEATPQSPKLTSHKVNKQNTGP
jgi:hypothetical protein